MPTRPKPLPFPDPYFKPGAHVEISSDDDGFRGSWFTGTIVHRIPKFNKGNVAFLVQYDHLMADETSSQPLRETFDIMQLRPLPPRELHRDFKFSEEVDAFYNDGWWEGVITEELGNGRFAVYFRASKEQLDFDNTNLRLHREWVNGNWLPPLPEQKESVSSKVEFDEATVERFKKGTLVEVSSDEDGFQGAWFAATVIGSVGKDKFLIEYKNLRTDDDKEFLREEIDTLHIRPSPPETNVVDCFNQLKEVDAFVNDGWWVGVISKVLGSSKYIVYFKATDEEIEFHHSELRVHQDLINGKWVIASQALKL